MFTLLLLSLLGLTTTAAGTIEIKPNVIVIPLTNDIEVTCLLSRVNAPTLSALFSLTLSHSNTMDEPDYRPLASVNALDNKLNTFSLDKTASVSGLVNNTGVSFLRLNWKNPKSDKAGLYRCSFNGVSASGHPLSLTSTSAVVVNDTDYDEMANKVISIEKELIDLKTKLEMLTSYTSSLQIGQNDLLTRLEKSRNAAFYMSSSFNGSRYYLTKDLDVLQVTWAQSTCELFGGYLAEIDTIEEFHFVRNFLVSKNLFDVVAIAGSDEAVEGQWVYSRNNTPAKVLNWAPGQPNEGRHANCLSIWKGGNWYMADSDCIHNNNQPNNPYVYSYLCEIPELEDRDV